MSLYDQVAQDLSTREYKDTTAELTPYESGRAEYPRTLIRLNNFHPYHTELMKKYGGVTFSPRDKGYIVNTWVALDFIVPNLKIPKMNLHVDRKVKHQLEEFEREVVGDSRFRKPSKDNVCYVPPLKGKPPYEEFQYETIANVLQRGAYGLFLKQGTGKSYVIASVLRYLFQKDRIDKALICTPGSGLLDIKRKIIAFAGDTFSDEDILVVTKKNRECLEDEITNKVIVMTYSTLRLVQNHYKKKYNTFASFMKRYTRDKRLAVIMDEGHNVSNHKSQQGKAAQVLASNSQYRILSTGTPADKPAKYYAMLRFIHPYLVRYLSYTDWTKCVADLGTAFSQFAIADYRPEDLRYFLSNAEPWYTNLQDADVLDLPPHYRKPVPIEFEDGRHKKIYEGFMHQQLTMIKEEMGYMHPRVVLNKFPYLLLSVDNPEILRDNPSSWYVMDPEDRQHKESERLNKLLEKFTLSKDHVKLPYLQDILEEHVDEGEEKVVVWTGHPATADALAEVLSKYNPLVIHGQSKKKGYTSEELKDHVVKTFTGTKKHKILIASYLVLDTALDIVEATTQVYFDMPYALTNLDQSTKRLHRAGQLKRVVTYYLLLANTIDETRYNIVMNKMSMDSKVLDGTLSMDEWKSLFQGEVPSSMKGSLEEAQNLF